MLAHGQIVSKKLQFQYLNRVIKTKWGVQTFDVLNHGVLYKN